ncbi:MAG: ribosome recycling factor [Bacilli bacterium]
MNQDIFIEAKEKMEKALDSLTRNFTTIRTGRANPSMLDHVMVDYYGVSTSLKQLAVISVPEGRQLLIKPFDRSALGAMEKGIMMANLGINPNNDGETIRLIIPALTEERRKDLTKQAKTLSEEAKIALRNIRHDINNKIKGLAYSEDEEKSNMKKVQDMVDNYNKQIDEVLKEKEKDIMEI